MFPLDQKKCIKDKQKSTNLLLSIKNSLKPNELHKHKKQIVKSSINSKPQNNHSSTNNIDVVPTEVHDLQSTNPRALKKQDCDKELAEQCNYYIDNFETRKNYSSENGFQDPGRSFTYNESKSSVLIQNYDYLDTCNQKLIIDTTPSNNNDDDTSVSNISSRGLESDSTSSALVSVFIDQDSQLQESADDIATLVYRLKYPKKFDKSSKKSKESKSEKLLFYINDIVSKLSEKLNSFLILSFIWLTVKFPVFNSVFKYVSDTF
ncbi:uncharacterized protein SCDLUD_002682 [Saccharomycodes ludwigii]|uniref:uncharacterized protein n=1 Tax=Saccharomycodes ludwigii TaxID=36035 RepID=UPI001E8C283E|nr:hypothetical protein SCDLUD_002682 [Saccharomycodes ludwigii]KAH3901196.1 hypothetical protein SCDLUD_002682 [Saccharomycodes ludwigii]